MDIYFVSESALCDQYMTTPNGKKKSLQKVVAPLRVEGTGTEKLRVFNGCNFYGQCVNLGCVYSFGSREASKVKYPKQK